MKYFKLLFGAVLLCIAFTSQAQFYAYGNLSSRASVSGNVYNITIGSFNGGYRAFPGDNYDVTDIADGMVVWLNCVRLPVTDVVSTSPLVLQVTDSTASGALSGIDLYGYRIAILQEAWVGTTPIWAFGNIADGNAGAQAGVSPTDGGCIGQFYGTQIKEAIESVEGGGGAPTGSAGGDLTGTYPNPTIAADAVTLAKQASGTANRLQGFDASGNPSEITVSGIAALSAGNLAVTEVDGSTTNELLEFTASSSAPGSPKQGDLWHDSDGDSVFVRDGGSWVFLAIRAGSGGGGGDDVSAFPNGVTLTPAEKLVSPDSLYTVQQLIDIVQDSTRQNLDAAYNNFGATASKITVDAAQGQTGGLEVENNTINDVTVDLQSTGDFVIQDAGVNHHYFYDDGSIVFNENSVATNFRVESDGDVNMLNVDGVNNRVGVGASPLYKFHVIGSSNTVGIGLSGTFAANDIGYYLNQPTAITGAFSAGNWTGNATGLLNFSLRNANTATGSTAFQLSGAAGSTGDIYQSFSGANGTYAFGLDQSDSSFGFFEGGSLGTATSTSKVFTIKNKGSGALFMAIGDDPTSELTVGLQAGRNHHIAGDWGLFGSLARFRKTAQADNFTATSGTVANANITSFDGGIITAINTGVTVTTAATVYIAEAPVNGTNATITNPLSLRTGSGRVRFGGYGSSTYTGTGTRSAAFDASDNMISIRLTEVDAVLAASGSTTTVVDNNKYAARVTVAQVTGASTIVRLPNPTADLAKMEFVKIKFQGIDTTFSATITTVGGTANIENAGTLVTTFNVGDTQDYAEFTFWTDGTTWFQGS